MSARVRIMVVFGTRPEAIKVAPVVQALEQSGWAEPVVTVTGQHRHILDQVLNLFDIEPNHDLNIIQPAQTLTDVTVRVLEGMAAVLERDRPDLVVVQGDTTTTFAAAMSAFYARIPVAHLEAGLRTRDLQSPYPEEMNRQATSRLASLHLAPTPRSRSNLLAEGIDTGAVVVTGNTVIDALHWTVQRRRPYRNKELDLIEADPRRILLVTAHRRESWGAGMASIGAALAALAESEPELQIVFPIHPNPVVRKAILPAVGGLENVKITEPLAYGDFTRLLDRAMIVLTDSGGVQEEAPGLGKPVLVMRDATERPEALIAGTARLVGTDTQAIVSNVRRLLHNRAAFSAMAHAVNPYGDGRAAERSLQFFARFFGLSTHVDEFVPVFADGAFEDGERVA